MNGDKWCAALAAIGGCVLWPGGATATETDGDDGGRAAQVDVSPDWLLGVGVSFTALAVVGTGAGALPGPLYSAGAERRLTESLWLMGALRGSFASQETSGQWASDVASYAVDAQLGLRHVINPDDRCQLSVFSSLGAFHGRSSGTSVVAGDYVYAVDVGYASTAWGLHVDAGLALDFWVAEQVALRVGTRLLSVGHQSHGDETGESEAWFAEGGLSPSFAVQLGL